MSFIYGVTGTTALGGDSGGAGAGRSADDARAWCCVLAGLGFKIAAFPFHMWAPDTYEAASTPFVAWLSVAPKAAGFIVDLPAVSRGRRQPRRSSGCRSSSALAGMTIVTGNLMAIPQQNIKRLLAYSGVAHIGYMLIGLAAMSSERRRDGALLSGRVSVREHGRVPRRGGRGAVGAVRRDRRLSRPGAALAAARAGDAGLPAVARRHSVRRRLLGEAVRLPGRRSSAACTAWCSSARC